MKFERIKKIREFLCNQSIKSVLLVLLVILLFILLLNKNHWKESRSFFTQVMPISGTINNKPSINIIDYSNKTADVCTREGCDLNFSFSKQRINKIFLAFNLNEAPDGLEIYGLHDGASTLIDSYNKSKNLEDLSKYNSKFKYNESDLGVRPYYESYISGDFDSIKIKILPVKEDRTITITDVFFYRQQPVSTPRFILNLLAIHERSIVSYLFYLVLFFIIIFPVGALLADKFFRGKINRLENVFISFGLSLLFWGCLGTTMLFVSQKMSLWLALLAVIFSIVLFIEASLFSKIKINTKIIKITLLFALYLVLYVFLFDGGQKFNSLLYKNDVYFDNHQYYDMHPGNYSSDQIVPYGTAKILLYRIQKDSKEYTNLVSTNYLSSRTQLFSHLAVPFLKVFGDHLLVYEILGLVCVLLLPLSVFMLAMEMTKDRRATYLAVFFAFTSPYLIYMFNITQLKIICTVLLTAYFYFIFKYKHDNKRINIIAGSFLAAVSMLIHNFTLIYVIAGIIYLSPNIFAWFKRKKFIDLLILLIPIAVFAVWFIYSYFDSKSLLVTGITATKSTMPGMDYFKQKLGSYFNILSPFLTRYLNFQGFFVANPAPMIAYRSEVIFRSTIYSLTSFVLFPFFIWAIIKHFKEYAHLWLYLAILVILTLCSDGNFTSAFGLHLYLVATIPLLLILIARIISKFSLPYIMGIAFLVLSESLFINFVVQKELISDQLFFQFQFPIQTFFIFLLLMLLQFGPLFYFLKGETSHASK